MELFETERLPLAARLRPRTLDEFFGQDHIIGPGRLLRRAIQADQLSSLILSGPPGTGKTTLARIIAARTQSQFLTVNAVLSGIKEIREAIQAAKSYRSGTNRRTILFVDEVHRWNKSQQDALLPWVEDGLFVLIGATTENPFFEVNRALLSRSRVFLLDRLSEDELYCILDFALDDRERGYGDIDVQISQDARAHLVQTAGGDARTLLNALELAVETSSSIFPPPEGETITIDLSVAEDSIQQKAILYDKDGDYHFDTISAFIKSVRGSDPDASLYWLARMIEAGEDPHYIFRRLLVAASEDIGLADPNALSVVVACATAFDRVGLPEGRFHLAQATLYLASTEKSNSTLGLFDAIETVRKDADSEVPSHLKDANRDGADLGHGKGYLYPHAYTDHWVAQKYLPKGLEGRVFYDPAPSGWEGSRRELLAKRRLEQLSIEEESITEIWSVPPRIDQRHRWSIRSSRTGERGGEEQMSPLLAGLHLSPTHRVLLAGDGVGTFVFPVFGKVTAGLTAIWTTPPIAQSIKQTFGTISDRIEAPEVFTLDSVPEEAYRGPFDTIVARSLYPIDPKSTLEHYLPLLAPKGVLRSIEIEVLSGDRPSTILKNHIDPALWRILEESEARVYTSQRERWNTRLSQWERETGETLTLAIEEQSQRETRFLDPEVISSWFHGDNPLTADLRANAPGDVLATIGTAIETFPPGEYPWNRVYAVLTLHRKSS